MTDYTGLVVDRNAVVSAVGDVMVSVSEHTYFEFHSVAVRATWRFGQNVVRPERCPKLTIAGPGS